MTATIYTDPQTRTRWVVYQPGLGILTLVLATALAHANTYNRLPLNLAVADAGLIALAVIGFRLGRIGLAPAGYQRLGSGLLVAATLYVTGQTIAALINGISVGAAVPVLVDIYPVLIAYLLLPVFLATPVVRTLAVAGLVGALVIAAAALLLTESDGRAAAFFPSANFGAHAAVTLTYVGLRGHRRTLRWLTVLMLPIAALALIATGSFGGVVAVAVLGAYDLWTVRRRLVGALRFLASVVTAGLLCLGALGAWQQINAAEFDVGTGLTSARLDHSEDSRQRLYGAGLELARSQPLGHGTEVEVELRPGVFIPVHNDPLSFVLEGGVLGFAGFLCCYGVWWRFLPRWGAARGLLLMLLVSGFFRETLNFRHAWFAIALLAAVDLVDRSRHSASPIPGRVPITPAGTPPAIE